MPTLDPIYPESLEFRNFNALVHLYYMRHLPVVYYQTPVANGDEYVIPNDRRRMPLKAMTVGALGGTDTIKVYGRAGETTSWHLLGTLDSATTEVDVNLPFQAYRFVVTLAGSSVPLYVALGG